MVEIMKYMMARKKEKGTKNLYDLFKHYNDEITFDIQYVPTGIDTSDFSFGIESELREVSFEDGSMCVLDDESTPHFFDLYFILENDDKHIYEHFLFETFDSNMEHNLANEIQDKELLDKAINHCKIFYGMLNSTYFLNLLNDQECIELLLNDGAVNINFELFVLEVRIV